MSQKRALISFTIIMLITLDLLTKNFAADLLQSGDFVPVVNEILVFRYVENHSMAFNFLSSAAPDIRLYSILTIKLFILLVLISVAVRQNSFSIPRTSAFILIIAGGAGNFIDRAANGYVTDFIHFYISDSCNFPVFNFADIFISSGIIILLFWGRPLTLFTKKE